MGAVMSLDFRDSNAVIAAVRPLERTAVTRKVTSSKRKFSTYLTPEAAVVEVEEEEIPTTDEILRRKMSLDPAIYMQDLYGEAYNPITGQVNHNDFLEKTQQKTEELSISIKEQLDTAGVQSDEPVMLTVDEGGKVIAAEENEDADVIETVFQENPDLAQDFRQVAQAQHWAALNETASTYVNTLYGTDNSQHRTAISAHFRQVFEQVSQTPATMSLSVTGLNSLSVEVAIKALEQDISV